MIKNKALNPLYFFVIAYIALQAWMFPTVYKIDFYDIFFKSVIAITLFLLLIQLNKVKHNRDVHKYLMSGFFFLFITLLTTTLDEIFTQPWLLKVLFKDIAQMIGFILVSIGINTWIIQNSDQSSKLKQLSETDELTNLYTRRHFNELLSNVLVTQRVEKESFSVLLINIDNFKLINEQHTQTGGDVVLKKLANKLTDCIRKTDTVARWGGEEFIILLNNSNDVIAKQVAEMIRAKSELLCVEYNKDIINITVSIGVATYQNEVKSSALINRVEQCLSEAKKSGKNKVLVSCNKIQSA